MKRVRLLSGRTETPEGGVVVRVEAHFGTGFVVHLVDAKGGKRTVAVSHTNDCFVQRGKLREASA